MVVEKPTFTPTERVILTLLRDGQPHKLAELRGCLSDDLAGRGGVSAHIFRLNRKLPENQALLCVVIQPGRFTGYRWVYLLSPPK
jgi:hypothetical protein